jgi:hypothetical protein
MDRLLSKYPEFSQFGENSKEKWWKNDLTEAETHRLQAEEIKDNENALYKYCVEKWISLICLGR